MVFEQLKEHGNPLEKNMAGQKFWRKTISNYTDGAYVEEFGETFDGHKLIYRYQPVKTG